VARSRELRWPPPEVFEFEEQVPDTKDCGGVGAVVSREVQPLVQRESPLTLV
jgi:hypothetical protein